jgi:hypothetical protein
MSRPVPAAEIPQRVQHIAELDLIRQRVEDEHGSNLIYLHAGPRTGTGR